MGNIQSNDLWRIFRVVSQPSRLTLLWLLFKNGEQCVSQLVNDSQMTRPNASIQLKTLYLFGLIRFRRKGMNVIYRAEADPSSMRAVLMLEALRESFDAKLPLDAIIRQVTAFTHGRRVEIVRALRDGPLSSVQLADRCGMTSSALSRQLIKLESRKVVRWDGKRYGLIQPKENLENALLQIVCQREGT